MALSGKVGGPACCVWAVFSLRGEEEAGRDCRKSGIPGIVFLDLLEEALSHIFLPRQSRSVDTNPYADLLALATPRVSKRIARSFSRHPMLPQQSKGRHLTAGPIASQKLRTTPEELGRKFSTSFLLSEVLTTEGWAEVLKAPLERAVAKGKVGLVLPPGPRRERPCMRQLGLATKVSRRIC